MKQVLFLALAIGINVCSPGSAAAYTMDGRLNDWGVTPFSDWTPSSPTAEWIVENNTNHQNDGSIDTSGFRESRDLEAIYFDSDEDYIYFAIVSSIAFDDSGISPKPEDIGIDLNSDGKYEFGLDLAYITADGTAVSKPVYSVTAWNNQNGADYQIANGTVIGSYTLVNRYLGEIEPGVSHEETYVLEGQVLRSVFGSAGASTDWTLFLAKYECITDYISVHGTASGQTPIPEPSSLILLGTALAGLRRKDFRCIRTAAAARFIKAG